MRHAASSPELDREALETGRRLTRPLAAQVLDRVMQPNLF